MTHQEGFEFGGEDVFAAARKDVFHAPQKVDAALRPDRRQIATLKQPSAEFYIFYGTKMGLTE